MIIRMAKVEIVGPKNDLLAVLELLRGQGVFQPDPQLLDRSNITLADRPSSLVLDESELRERSYFEELRERIQSLVALLPPADSRPSSLQPLPVMDVLDELVDQHLQQARRLTEELSACLELTESLSRDLIFWTALEPLFSELPANSNLALYGVTIRDASQLLALEEMLQQRTRGRCQISTTTTTDGNLVGLIATDAAMDSELCEALTDERVPELYLPEDLSSLPLPQRIATLQQQLEENGHRCAGCQQQLDSLAHDWLAVYRRALDWLTERLALYNASAAAYATRQCFVIQGWMTADRVDALRHNLSRTFDGRAVLEQRQILEEDLARVPVLLRNPSYFAPFEVFSRLLPLPRYTSYDPTPFIGLFFPVLFGMILGDIGYGLILTVVAWLLATRCKPESLPSNLGKILGVAAAYTILFGLLFGELFGNLGELWFGLHPLWIDRSKAILPMITFAISVGTMHVLLGLGLGIWSDLRRRQGREALGKLTTLLAVLLIGLALYGWMFPAPWLAVRPLLIGVIVLLPVLIFAGGLLAPLELLKTLGNIISYVRIMAIGLGSVLLAVVANQLGGMTGDVLIGALVAGILHAFNLLLGVFAPTVHSLRLHYVEFFSKFLDLGGRRFEPWHKNHS
jgi:V/A-type H+-transporting ATPase subunit I